MDSEPWFVKCNVAIAIDAQRYTGNPMIRNGVELRMLDIAKRLYLGRKATPDGERQP